MGEDGWLGVHNAFLMIAGEAGIIALLPMLIFCLWHVRSIYRTRSWGSIAFFVPSIVAMMTTHGALGLRFVAASLGVSLAISSIAKMRSFADAAIRRRGN